MKREDNKVEIILLNNRRIASKRDRIKITVDLPDSQNNLRRSRTCGKVWPLYVPNTRSEAAFRPTINFPSSCGRTLILKASPSVYKSARDRDRGAKRSSTLTHCRLTCTVYLTPRDSGIAIRLYLRTYILKCKCKQTHL